MPLSLIEKIENLLKQGQKFVDSEGKLFIPQILEAIEKIDSDFIKILISDETAKSHFFTKIEDVYVLDQNKLIEFFTLNNYFDNSYTAYTNKIGLIKKDSFIKKFDDVVLAWPHKDCVLEGGQTKDDDKKNEVFYNEILSRNEIDRLFEPKVLTNIKRYFRHSREGGNPACERSIPSEITMDDNLIIKGNNLIALHSLKKKFAGKVKLIYIDPPYNTGNDSFGYNDRYNHSTWLTFMKNRLEIAREFLRDDGAIFVSIDDNEQAYLKVLMDEVFERVNFVATIIWEKKYSPQNDAKWFSDNHDNILVFAKNKNTWRPNLLQRTEEQNKRYKNLDNDPRGDWKSSDLSVKTYSKEYDYPITTPSGKEVQLPAGRSWMTNKTRMQELINDNRIWFGKNNNAVPSLKRFLSEVKDGITPLTIWFRKDVGDNQEGKQELLKLMPENSFQTPKPSRLIKHVLNLATNSNDIILDFHAGSGTTAHAVLDLNKEDGGNRKFILIEQMDYIEDITCKRVEKVIEKNGEGSFVYAELKTIENFKDCEVGKLNSNMQYLPISEMEDEDYGISIEEIVVNKAFYGLE